MSVLLCVHSKYDIFPFFLLSLFYQGNTFPSTIPFVSLVDFQTAHKNDATAQRLSLTAGPPPPKKKPYITHFVSPNFPPYILSRQNMTEHDKTWQIQQMIPFHCRGYAWHQKSNHCCQDVGPGAAKRTPASWQSTTRFVPGYPTLMDLFFNTGSIKTKLRSVHVHSIWLLYNDFGYFLTTLVSEFWFCNFASCT